MNYTVNLSAFRSNEDNSNSSIFREKRLTHRPSNKGEINAQVMKHEVHPFVF